MSSLYGKTKNDLKFQMFPNRTFQSKPQQSSWGTRVAQAVEHPTSAQVMISEFLNSSPALGCADSSEPGACFGFCVALSVCPLPHLCVLSLFLSTLSNINKHKQTSKKINPQ